MKLVNLIPVDGQQKSVEIKIGRTIIGRGPLLECSDKKVSRNHAVIEVRENGEILLTPTHVNPCFYLPNDSNAGFEVLKKDCAQLIHNGDSFSLLPNNFRYRVIIAEVPDYDNDFERAKAAAKDSKKEDPVVNGEKKETEVAPSVKQEDDETAKDNGKPIPPVKNGLSPSRAKRSDKNIDLGTSKEGAITRTTTAATSSSTPSSKQTANANKSDQNLAKEAASSKELISKEKTQKDTKPTRDAKKMNDDSKQSKTIVNSKDKSLLASKKILTEKSGAKKDQQKKEKADLEKQKQLKNFDFDEDDEVPLKPTSKRTTPKASQVSKKALDKPSTSALSTSEPNQRETTACTRRTRSSPPPQTNTGPSGSRNTRQNRATVHRISLDDFLASDDEWIATYTSSDEERKRAKRRQAKRKSATADGSSDEDEWSDKKSKKKSPTKKSRTNNSDDDSNSEVEQKKSRPSRSNTRTLAGRKKRQRKAESEPESSEAPDDDYDEKNADNNDKNNNNDDDKQKEDEPRKLSQTPKKNEANSPSRALSPPKKKVVRRKKSYLYAESEEDFQRQLARAIRESKKEQLKK